jgi:hypothetical protein
MKKQGILMGNVCVAQRFLILDHFFKTAGLEYSMSEKRWRYTLFLVRHGILSGATQAYAESK